MNSTPSSNQHQRNRVSHYANTSSSYTWFNLITSEQLLDTMESLLPEHRERQYPPTECLSLFLAQAMSADRSCQNIVNQTAVDRMVGGLPPVSTRTGGYCRARQRLPRLLVEHLSRHVAQLMENESSDEWLWQGRRVCLVDGTSVTMPDTPENQSRFPQQRGQKPGLGFPICRIVGITSLSTGALLNAAMGRFSGKGSDEQSLLRTVMETFNEGDVVMGDSFFATWFFILEMQTRGIDLLMEQQGARRRVTDFRKGEKLGQRDHLIALAKPKNKPGWMSQSAFDEAPESITVREFKAGGKTMVTTMLCPKVAPKTELKALYKSRWSVELDLRNIKDTLGMNILSCKSPDMVEKEIWVYLLAYNLIRWMMVQSALLADVNPRRLSFKHSLQLWLIAASRMADCTPEQRRLFLKLIAEQPVANRPGRVEPRAVKRRPKAFPLLTIPRDQARQKVLQYGHPKKLK